MVVEAIRQIGGRLLGLRDIQKARCAIGYALFPRTQNACAPGRGKNIFGFIGIRIADEIGPVLLDCPQFVRGGHRFQWNGDVQGGFPICGGVGLAGPMAKGQCARKSDIGHLPKPPVLSANIRHRDLRVTFEMGVIDGIQDIG
uniref:Uncharacterized protein n=1 Tax=Candidatus Kentrum sp. TC TaxID=2126339 RepID=A0A451A8R6_9GAMM|nr:MAG: hypothetical protein BECKTC1821F_GA0114240_10741 [Candidatus Kentron sp. TC]